MPVFAAGFLLGNVALQGFSELPEWPAFLLAPLVLLAFTKRSTLIFTGAAVGSFLWVLFVAGAQKNDILPVELESVELEALLRVISIPADKGRVIRFDAQVENSHGAQLPQKVRLSFYPPENKTTNRSIHLGDMLAAKLRLKRPHGHMNPGGFDYERYLFSQGIGANGYIRNFRLIKRTGEWSPSTLRYRLHERLRMMATPNIGAIIALALGERGLLKKTNRELLLATGTGHLFAISGLHITLVFGFVFFLFNFLWTRFLLTSTCWPSLLVAMIPAFFAACTYAWLAGFTIPTQRALIMLGCFVVSAWLRRQISLTGALAATVVVILAYDPLSTLTVSFWMSFIAVALIALCVRIHSWSKKEAWWKMQVILALALLPASLCFFAQGALIAPIANLIAVPLVSLLVLPSVLLAVLLIFIDVELAGYFVYFADFLLELMWQGGEWIRQFGFLQLHHYPPVWSYPFSVIGIIAIILASQWRHKLSALVLLLPLSVNAKDTLPIGAFEAAFLDVGQGLSVFIATRGHNLLFDAGPTYRTGSSAAEIAIIPYLRWRHVDRLDTLLISHGDNDHAGGMGIIEKHFKPRQILANTVNGKTAQKLRDCYKGQVWIWDEVLFELIHPPKENYPRLKSNDSSCVLKITAQNHSLLLTADIEKNAETLLLMNEREKLKASIVLIPHHGSLTSSTDAFVTAVSPRFAVVTSGYRNHFGLPKEEVLEKYLAICARVFNTVETGALVTRFVPGHKVEIRHLHRKDAKRFWHTGDSNYSLRRC